MTVKDFSENVMYSGHNGNLSGDTYHSLTDILDITGDDRTFYCTVDPSTGTWSVNARSDPTLTYTKDGNYIVFRNIDMSIGYNVTKTDGTRGDWRPLMFSGNMYGITSTEDGEKVTDIAPYIADSTTGSIGQVRRPVISNVAIAPVPIEQFNKLRIDTEYNTGVGFFGTLTGKFNDSSYISEPMAVKNIKIVNGTVNNPCIANRTDVSFVSSLTTALAAILGPAVDTILAGLTNKSYSLSEMLTSLLNARELDPSLLATGAFAGRILGDATVEDCMVESFTVTTVQTGFEDGSTIEGHKCYIVGKGGFVGYTEGETRYSGLSGLLSALVTGLSGVLNLIPGLGLGDLVTLLLKNVLDVGKLIPTGYVSPQINRCTAKNTALSTEDGKYGVGGFVGSMAGTVMKECSVVNEGTLNVKAHVFGGGFAGIARDAEIRATLSTLGVNVLSALEPQSEIITSSVSCAGLNVSGGSKLGGFVGAMANSYTINDTISGGTLNVSGSGDYVGGFCGRAQLGSLFTLGEYLPTDADLLSTLSTTVTDLVKNGHGSPTLLDICGIAQSAVMGCQILDDTTVHSSGSYVGGMLGRGDGVYVMKSSAANLRLLPRYDDTDNSGSFVRALPVSDAAKKSNLVNPLRSVSADGDFVGGMAGYLTSANIGGVLGGTLGVAQFMGFNVCDTTIRGISTGYTVTGGTVDDSTTPPTFAGGNYVAGGIGWAVGGKAYDIELELLGSVTGNNYVGGCVGATGPGDLVDGGGLDVTLLGLSVLQVSDLLSLVQGERTTYKRVNVTGTDSGYTVLERQLQNGDVTEYMAGGWAGSANSVRVVDCHANNLLSVNANMHDGYAGGYVGSSSAGGLAGVADKADVASSNLISLGQLVDAVPYLIPSYDGCTVKYVDGGFVQGDRAGGFAANFQSGKVNSYTMQTVDISGTTYTGVNPIEDTSTPYTYNFGNSTTPWSVYNIHHVRGGRYAGGWGGKVYSGALVSAGGGLSILGKTTGGIDATQLVGVAKAYVPIVAYAGVNSDVPANSDAPTKGFSVFAAHDYEDPAAPANGGSSAADPTPGMAGGFIGFGSGVQVSYSHVFKLRHGEPAVPDALTEDDNKAYARFDVYPAALESQDGSNYMVFSVDPDTIPYAVAGAEYAGGYIGYMNIGSAASVGDGLAALGSAISLDNVVEALSVVVSTIEHSNVTGRPGGFNVIASPRINLHSGGYGDANGKGIAYAGGYAGKISGGHIQDGNVKLFYYIVGEIAAGGYVGEAIPGAAADVLKDSSSIANLAGVTDLVSLMQDFVPTIRNSETTCVPCGGAVRAQCPSNDNGDGVVRGMAGGYIGHGRGVQIWGMSNDRWKDSNPYGTDPVKEPQRECAAIRIRSVYGAEYAGGYCGLMEPGDTASSGGLSLLGGLISTTNLLGALKVVYSTIKRGVVYGPLQKTDVDTWNAWVQYVGSQGAFYPELARLGAVTDQAALDAVIADYYYGTHVVAGRHIYDNNTSTIYSGCAGGFVGALHSGVIRHCRAEQSKLVMGMRSAGGFVGDMQTKGGAELGSASILSLPLDLGNMVSVLNVFTPEISESGTEGYESGLTVVATDAVADAVPDPLHPGFKLKPGVGMAGGFCGASYGGQIGLHQDDGIPSVWVHRLKLVHGTNDIGGFVGNSVSGSVLDVSTGQATNGFVQNILDSLVSTAGDLANVAQATLSTVKYAEVTSVDSTWGLVVDGEYTESGDKKYAYAAGGFAGLLEGAVLGERNIDADTLTVSKLRSVNGGHYVGGFFGLGDTGSVASVGGSGNTKLLSLINTSPIDVLSAFRTYIYRGSVEGVSDGIRVTAHDWTASGVMTSYQVSGAAGGFGGALVNGTVEKSSVDELNTVTAPHYAAGFVGFSDRNGVATVDGLSVSDDYTLGKLLTILGLDLSANASVGDIVGSTFEDCTVDGFAPGFITTALRAQAPVAGTVNQADLIGSCAAGFIGYGDISQIERCDVTNYKLAQSPQIAGGFIGRGSNAYLIGASLSSGLTEGLLKLVNLLLRVLYVNGLENLNLINLPGEYAGLQLLADGNLLYVNLLGLRIGVSVASQTDSNYSQDNDLATVVIGSSTITLPVTNGEIDTSSPNVQANVVEGNRTTVKYSTVTGIGVGYDVFGGGATQDADGTDFLGYAGGFVGYNNSGFFSNDRMRLCDVVRGSALYDTSNNQLTTVGPFSGILRYNANTHRPLWYEGVGDDLLDSGIDRNNWYSVYRTSNSALTEADTAGGTKFADMTTDSGTGTSYNRYDVHHYQVIETHPDLKDAKQKGSSTEPLDAWVSPAKAVLMLDRAVLPNPESEAVKPDEKKDPCEGRVDITVHKKWRDYNNMFGSRPQALEVEVWVIDVGTTPRAQLVQAIFPESDWNAVPMTALHAQFDDPAHPEKDRFLVQNASFDSTGNPILLSLTSDDANESLHWKARLENLPVAYRAVKTDAAGNKIPVLDTNGDPVYDTNGDPVYETEVHYLQYVVVERVPDGYKLVQYEMLENTASVVILNELNNIVLPATGGMGYSIFHMLAGIPFFFAAALFFIEKRRRREVQNE